MNKSDSIQNLAKALVNVQGNLKPAIKDAKNPFFKSSYSTLNSVWDACRKHLTDNGLSIIQLNQASEQGVIIETILLHESGEWVSGEIFIPLNKMDAQGVGSACSYGRRYGLAAMVGIVADEDDDANAAQPRSTPQHSQNVKQMPPQVAQSSDEWPCGAQLKREILDLEAALDSKGIKSTPLRDALEKSRGTRSPATLSKDDAASYRDYLKKRNSEQKSA